MDDDDRESNAFSDNDQDEVMDDVDEPDHEPDPEPDQEPEEDDDDGDDDDDADQEQDSVQRHGAGAGSGKDPTGSAAADGTAMESADTMAAVASATSRSTPLPTSQFKLRPRPEALSAKVYDIIPTMAAPQATSINALAVTPDLRYWMTGGSDGYIRKYDGPGTINGKQLLTVAQRHPFVDSVVKAGILMSYWENEEPPSSSARGTEEHLLSPVYSLAVHSRALWLLAGTEGGGINLQSVRHDEGKRITCLQQHTNAVSVLQLLPDEKSVLSGSWDKKILDWDLNTGQVRRQFDGSGGQISVIEMRPASGAPIPTQSMDVEPLLKDNESTFTSSNSKSLANGVNMNGASGNPNAIGSNDAIGGTLSATMNGDDPIPDNESLFGSPGGSLFGGSDAMGANPFGDDDIGISSGSGAIGDEVAGFSHDDDMVLDTGDTTNDVFAPTVSLEGAPLQKDTASNSATLSGDTQNKADVVAKIEGIDPTKGLDALAQKRLEQDQQDQELQKLAETQLLETDRQQSPSAAAAGPHTAEARPPASLVYSSQAGPAQYDPTQVSENSFFSASIDGTIRVWDRRQSLPVARIENRVGVPPWCTGACWSPDGNRIYAGRRNGIVEEFDIHKSKVGWQPERALRFPAGSGPVSAVRSMVNGRHLVCASHDILRLYDLHDTSAARHSHIPFLIIPGPPRAGVISHLYIDQTSRFMISTAGTRGWEGSNTEVLVGYEISPVTK